MEIEVIDCQVVESAETLVSEYLGGKGVEFWKVVLWVAAVVWLQDLSQEEDAVGLDGEEYGGFLGLRTHFNQI